LWSTSRFSRASLQSESSLARDSARDCDSSSCASRRRIRALAASRSASASGFDFDFDWWLSPCGGGPSAVLVAVAAAAIIPWVCGFAPLFFGLRSTTGLLAADALSFVPGETGPNTPNNFVGLRAGDSSDFGISNLVLLFVGVGVVGVVDFDFDVFGVGVDFDVVGVDFDAVVTGVVVAVPVPSLVARGDPNRGSLVSIALREGDDTVSGGVVVDEDVDVDVDVDAVVDAVVVAIVVVELAIAAVSASAATRVGETPNRGILLAPLLFFFFFCFF